MINPTIWLHQGSAAEKYINMWESGTSIAQLNKARRGKSRAIVFESNPHSQSPVATRGEVWGR